MLTCLILTQTENTTWISHFISEIIEARRALMTCEGHTAGKWQACVVNQADQFQKPSL